MLQWNMFFFMGNGVPPLVQSPSYSPNSLQRGDWDHQINFLLPQLDLGPCFLMKFWVPLSMVPFPFYSLYYSPPLPREHGSLLQQINYLFTKLYLGLGLLACNGFSLFLIPFSSTFPHSHERNPSQAGTSNFSEGTNDVDLPFIRVHNDGSYQKIWPVVCKLLYGSFSSMCTHWSLLISPLGSIFLI